MSILTRLEAKLAHPYRVVQSWDVAMKPDETSDYSVCTTWLMCQDRFYLWKLRRLRLGFPALVRVVMGAAQDDRAEVLLIEDKASGTALIQELRARKAIAVPPPIPITPRFDKVTRVHSETPAMESGQVLLKASAPWLADLKAEIAQFPNGRHDDQIDSITQS